MKAFRIFSLIVSIAIIATLLVMVFSYHLISSSAKDRLYSDIQSVPPVEVGLLLGTSPRTRSGTESAFFQNRMLAAASLYRAGKIQYILASGDNSNLSYNEPMYMHDELIRLGVPEQAIVLDYAGFSTLDSVIRAKEVFGQRRVLVISQRFHNERALYIASSIGVDALAFNASDVGGYAGAAVLAREVLARVKALLDVHVINRQPKFLGEPEAIPPDEASY